MTRVEDNRGAHVKSCSWRHVSTSHTPRLTLCFGARCRVKRMAVRSVRTMFNQVKEQLGIRRTNQQGTVVMLFLRKRSATGLDSPCMCLSHISACYVRTGARM